MWTALAILFFGLPIALVVGVVGYVYWYARRNMLDTLVRGFVEKPLFVIPRGEPDPAAEEVRFRTPDGLNLQGAYFRAQTRPRKGVIVFGIEYGSDRWSCRPYCDPLLAAGYDVFAYEPRNHGKSDSIPGYEPIQWLTRYEVADARAALAYVKARADADPRGVGWFGVSKGANAGLAVMASDPYVRCGVTDGAFGLVSVMTPYMRHWIRIYNRNFLAHGLAPGWFYGHWAMVAVRRVERERRIRFYRLDRQVNQIRQPLLMIHGEADSYIKVEMARALFQRAAGPKEFWAVPGARHNQSVTIAGPEYARRVVAWFDQHLSRPPSAVPGPGSKTAG